jgi:LDH2 family malate/lactate/ureidoglycolate dehydrogenase
VYLQVMDPAAFGGAAEFVRQTGFIAAACRGNPPAPGVQAVRLRGDQALARKRHALAPGLRLCPGIMAALEPWAGKLGIAPPEPTR